MGATLSSYYNNEVPFVPVCDFAISDGDIRRLWSYYSGSGGRYIQITDECVPGAGETGQCYIVAANGEAEGPTLSLTDIQFNQTQPIPQMFKLSFHKYNTWYTAHAEDNSELLTAYPGNLTNNMLDTGDTSFEVMHLFTPNRPYVVLRSNKKLGGEDLYLSSDGAGNLRLKVWNHPIPLPPTTSAEVDPALLFRLVRPSGQN